MERVLRMSLYLLALLCFVLSWWRLGASAHMFTTLGVLLAGASIVAALCRTTRPLRGPAISVLVVCGISALGGGVFLDALSLGVFSAFLGVLLRDLLDCAERGASKELHEPALPPPGGDRDAAGVADGEAP